METTRPLGRSGIEVSALGFGCWAIGFIAQSDGQDLLALSTALAAGFFFSSG